MTTFTKPIGATVLVQAGQPCGDSFIPDGHECRIGGAKDEQSMAGSKVKYSELSDKTRKMVEEIAATKASPEHKKAAIDALVAQELSGEIKAPFKSKVKPDREGDLAAEMSGGTHMGTVTEKAEDGNYNISMHRIHHPDPSAGASRIYHDFQGVGNVAGVKLHKPTKSMHRVEVTSEDGDRHWFFVSNKT